MSYPRAWNRRIKLHLEELEARLMPDAASYVSGLYEQVLHRSESLADMTYWTGQLQRQGNAALAADLWLSAEHRGAQVDTAYQNYLNRSESNTDRQYWVNRLTHGGLSEVQMDLALLTSPEYLADHPGSGNYVQALYHNVLGRTASASEQRYWTQQLQAGTSDARAAQAILTSLQAEEDAVAQDYQTLLGARDSPADYAYWVTMVQQNSSPFLETLATDLLTTSAFIRSHSTGTPALAPKITGLPSSGHSPQGTAFTLQGSITNALSGELVAYAWKVTRNGAPLATGIGTQFSLTLNTAGTYTVMLTATNQLGDQASASQTVIVSVPPTATLVAPSTVNEGSAFTMALTNPADTSSADTAAGFHYAFALDGASLASVTYASASTSPSQSFTFHDGLSSHTVEARILSQDGGFTDYTASIQVNSVAPTATLVAPTTVNEGSAFVVALTNPVDPSNPDTTAGFHYAFALDGASLTGVTYASASTGSAQSFTFTDGLSTHTVTVRILAADGDFTNYTATIHLSYVPPTAIIGGPYATALGSAIAFTGSATDPSAPDTAAGFQYSWTFGDGGTSTLQSPGYTYATAGVYTVTLTVTDTQVGTSTVVSTTASVTPPPSGTTLSDPGFETPSVGTGANAFTYDPTSSPWTYSGDSGLAGNNSVITNAIGHAPEGTQVVFLNGVSSVSQSLTLDAGTYAVTFSSVQLIGYVGQEVEVLVDSIPEGTISPVGIYYATYASNTFTVAAGTHTITLAGISRGTNVYIAFVDNVAVVAAGQSPLATITGAPASGHSPEGTPITLQGGVSNSSVLSQYSYAWQVTKNNSPFAAGSGAQFTFTPDDVGVYSVTLTVTDQLGRSNSITQTIAGDEVPPTATLSAPASVNDGNTFSVGLTNPVDFSGVATQAGFHYAFAVDGASLAGVTYASAGASPSQNFTFSDGPSTHTVTVRIFDENNGFTDYTASIQVRSAPPTPIIGGPYGGIQGSAIAFTGSATDSNAVATAAGFQYSWNFGDGSTSSLQSPSHTYANAGTYTVALTVTDVAGGSATARTTAAVTTLPLGTTLSDPGFELPALGTGTAAYRTDPTGSPWTFSGGAGVAGNGSALTYVMGPAPQGTQVAFLNGVSSVSQSLIMAAGVYDIAIAAVQLTGYSGQSIQVLVDGVSEGTITPVGTAYAEYASNSFTVTAGTHTITLAGLGQTGQVAFVDNVIVEAGNPYIRTSYLTIPNFGAGPNEVSLQSGNWSNPNTWSLGRLPTTGDVVSIKTGTTVTYNVVSTAAVETVVIQAGGALVFRTDINTELTVVNLLVLQGGDLQIGTVANPVAANVTAQVVFANEPLNTTTDPQEFGNGLIGLGTVTMCGTVESQTSVELAVEPHAGDTTLTLSQPVSGWQPGDQLILPDTRQLDNSDVYLSYTSELETVTIARISADGTVVTLTSPLLYDHLGARDSNGNLLYLTYIADKTRNVLIHSQSPTGTRGYTLFTDRADVDIRYVTFGGLGRTTDVPDSDTVMDLFGNVISTGTNEGDREAVTFLDLFGPVTAPADGYQFTFVGNVVTCPLHPMPFRWGITISNSDYGLIKNNVVVNWAGAGIATEKGSESYNVIEGNFVAETSGPGARGNLGLDGDGYWITGPLNYVMNNIATDINPAGGPYSYGFELNFSLTGGNQTIPLFQGADPSIPGQGQVVNLNATPLLEFANNEVYGATQGGLSYYWLDTNNNSPLTGQGSTISNFTVWNFYSFGIFGYQSYQLTINGYTAIGDKTVLAGQNIADQGILFSDYFTESLTITNANIQNLWVGIATPYNVGGGTNTIENSNLVNLTNIGSGEQWSVSYNVDYFAAKTLVVNNVQFGTPLTGSPLIAIAMSFPTPADIASPSGGYNLVVSDQVFVYNYDGITGDNFQVFYAQQAANFIVPQSVLQTFVPDGTHRLLGSPVAGLTNQQNWDLYGIAIAGAVAPASAVSMAGFLGAIVSPI